MISKFNLTDPLELLPPVWRSTYTGASSRCLAAEGATGDDVRSPKRVFGSTPTVHGITEATYQGTSNLRYIYLFNLIPAAAKKYIVISNDPVRWQRL